MNGVTFKTPVAANVNGTIVFGIIERIHRIEDDEGERTTWTIGVPGSDQKYVVDNEDRLLDLRGGGTYRLGEFIAQSSSYKAAVLAADTPVVVAAAPLPPSDIPF